MWNMINGGPSYCNLFPFCPESFYFIFSFQVYFIIKLRFLYNYDSLFSAFKKTVIILHTALYLLIYSLYFLISILILLLNVFLLNVILGWDDALEFGTRFAIYKSTVIYARLTYLHSHARLEPSNIVICYVVLRHITFRRNR